MRNLKKVLALTLAIALVLSLSVTAGAVKFTDQETITAKYQDAVNLMSELNIMNGFPDGKYQPQGDLTRAQYLKMLYVVMNRGVDDGATLYSDVQPFPFYDVRADQWFNGYVKWGYGRQIISGRGGGVFDPNGTVTGFEALKMSLTALGYSTEIEGYLGDTYKTNVLNDAQDAGLLVDLETANLNAVLPREQAAQLLRNTLFAQMVNYNTTYIPAKMEKGQTMAFNYFNLYILRGRLVGNEWASVSGAKPLTGEIKIITDAQNIPKDIEGNQIGTGTYTIPYASPTLELLGHEVIVYARYSKNYTVNPFDKIYGEVAKSSRSQSKTQVTANVITAYGSDNTNNTQFIWAFHGDRLNLNINPGATVSINYGTPTYIDGTTVTTLGAAMTTFFTGPNTLKAGTEVTAIDYNNDGTWDYLLISERTYAKVVAVTDDGKLSAVNGDAGTGDFDGPRTLSAKEKSKIYNSANLKVDDRIVYYPVGSNWGAVVVEPFKGTLTASREGGTVAFVSGKEYKQSFFNTRVTDLDEVLQGGNFNTEKEYYVYRDRIVEGPELSGAPTTWALVKDSYFRSNFSGFTVGDAQVSLLLADGTSGVYNVSAIYNKDGDKVKLYGHSADNIQDAAFTAATEGRIVVDHDADGNISEPGTFLLSQAWTQGGNAGPVVMKASISDDGKSVELYDVGDYATASAGTSVYKFEHDDASYKNGSSRIDLGGSNGNKFIIDGTVFFVYNGNSGSPKFSVYKGKNLPTFAANGALVEDGNPICSYVYPAGTNGKLNASSGGGTADTQTSIGAAFINNSDIAQTTTNRKFGYVMTGPSVYWEDGKSYASIKLFDGTKIDDYLVVPGVRAQPAGTAYTPDLIDDPADDLTTYSGDSSLRVGKGNIVEYSLNADGKISALARLGAPDASGGITDAMPTASNAFEGNYIIRNATVITFFQGTWGGAISGIPNWNVAAYDAEVFRVNTDNGTAEKLTGIPASYANYALRATIVLDEDSNITQIYILDHKSGKDVTGYTPSNTDAWAAEQATIAALALEDALVGYTIEATATGAGEITLTSGTTIGNGKYEFTYGGLSWTVTASGGATTTFVLALGANMQTFMETWLADADGTLPLVLTEINDMPVAGKSVDIAVDTNLDGITHTEFKADLAVAQTLLDPITVSNTGGTLDITAYDLTTAEYNIAATIANSSTTDGVFNGAGGSAATIVAANSTSITLTASSGSGDDDEDDASTVTFTSLKVTSPTNNYLEYELVTGSETVTITAST